MANTRYALPVEPLLRIAATMSDNSEFSQEDLARLIGTTGRAVSRWKSDGGIPWISADEAAVALGLHPLLVWGDEWLNVKGDFDQIAAEVAAEMETDMIDAIVAEAMEA